MGTPYEIARDIAYRNPTATKEKLVQMVEDALCTDEVHAYLRHHFAITAVERIRERRPSLTPRGSLAEQMEARRSAREQVAGLGKRAIERTIFNLELPDGRKLGEVWNYEWSTYQRECSQFAALFGWLIKRYGATQQSMRTADIAKPSDIAAEWKKISAQEAA